MRTTAADTFKALSEPVKKSCANCMHDRILHDISNDSCGVDYGYKEYQFGNECKPDNDDDDEEDYNYVFKHWEWDRKTK